MTNRAKIVTALQSGRRLTAAIASTELGVNGLSSVISNIRCYGFNIRTRRVRGDGGRFVTEYWLAERQGPREWKPNQTGVSEIPTGH